MAKNLFNFYTDKFNKRNLKKAFRYIFTGQFRHLFMIIKNRWMYIKPEKIKHVNIAQWIAQNVISQPDFSTAKFNETIDIIIPVYNGIEYFDALFSSIKRTSIAYNLYIVDDCSPDVRVAEYLFELAKNDSRVTIITNEENLGFVHSVNKAFEQTKNHVALLNSDIELPPYWLERLMYPIVCFDHVASVTPFTNSGTICSFPKIGEDNSLFESLSCEEIDAAFQCIKPSFTALPTGVGFCMGISRDALNKIGYFDAETFSKGYGEENDWCQRAIKAGYENVMAENLFVYHKHCGSFSSEEKNALAKQNIKRLLQKHPKYNTDVADFFGKDPLKNFRNFAAMLLLSEYKSQKQLLIFDHNLGGGASEYLDDKIRQILSAGESAIIIRYDITQWFFLFEYKCKEYVFRYRFDKAENLENVLNYLRCNEIIVNELVTYPDVYGLLRFITEMKSEYKMKLTMYIHDYFSVCPMINLINNKHVYCRLPSQDVCDDCFKWRNDDEDYESMEKWRKNWGDFLASCNEIIAFSNDSRLILEKAYGSMNNIEVIPHNADYVIKPGKKYKTTDTINIGLIGVLTHHKGLFVIKEMLKLIKRNKMNVRIILIGSSKKQLKSRYFRETGRYNKESLPLLTLKNDIDLYFISSIVPETFSYTTEEAIKMDIPVAVFNLGAPAERVSNYEKGLIIDTMDAQTALREIVGFVEEKVPTQENPYHNVRVLFIGEYISFSSRYRVDHFREQLLVQGIVSDYINIRQCSGVDVEHYDTAVIYRCRQTPKIEGLIKSFQEKGKKVYYDIDDYTFDYEQIKNLAFLSGDEYKDFAEYANEIKRCMSLCDGFITSTTNMKKVINTAFPDAPIVVNRNAASMEMTSLSITARSNAVKSADRIVMGYFSGSKTHDADFKLISNVIIALFEKYEYLHLMIIGCLSLPKEFEAYEERVTLQEFVDWRKLPGLIASIDINLMPVEDTLFHRCKSENKWMEAALVAVPTVCSYNDELEQVIQDGITGFLCKNNAEWNHTLSKLMEKPELRKKIGKAANEVVMTHYLTTVTGKAAKDFILTSPESREL